MAQVGGMDAESRKLFQLYVKDHFAGAVGGTELCKRAATREKGSPFGVPLEELSADIEHDLQHLREVAETMGADPKALVKESLAWFAEKLGRLKLNGRIVERSPLSLVLELELLQGAVMSKRAVWQTLSELREHEPSLDRFEIDEMLHRAEEQHDRLRELHQRAVRRAFSHEVAHAAHAATP